MEFFSFFSGEGRDKLSGINSKAKTKKMRTLGFFGLLLEVSAGDRCNAVVT